MRGRFQDQGGMFSYIHPEKRIPTNHPLRKIRELVLGVLKELNHTFRRLYSHEGRPSIPPEQLLSALILQVLYSVRSERQLMEQLDYNLLLCLGGPRLCNFAAPFRRKIDRRNHL
jgi:transposase